MVVELDLSKTYGQQNEDIAKKNKYNSVVVDVTSNIENESGSEEVSFDFLTTSEDSGSESAFTKTVIKEEDWWRGNWMWEKCTVRNPVFKGTVSYKKYYVTLNKSDYPQLAYISRVPLFSSSFSGSYKEEISTKSATINTNTGNADDAFSAYKQYFEDLTLTSPIFSSASPNITDYSFTNDIYTVDIPDDPATEEVESTEEKNIMTDISSFVESAKANTYISIKEILEYINPKITNVTNNTDTVKFTIQAPYKIQIYQSTDSGCLDKTWSENKFYGEIKSYEFREYTISSVHIDISVEVNTESLETKFYDGDREYSAQQSYMFNDSNYMYFNKNKQYASWFADGIVEAYKNGKMILNIKYPIGELHDTTGGNIVYIEGYGIAREVDGNYFDKNGEQMFVESGKKISYNIPLEAGILCKVVDNGNPIYQGSKYFLIQNVNFDYTGIAVNEITAIESASEPNYYVVVYEQPEHSVIRVENSAQGVIPSGGAIKANYLEIYAEFDEGYGLAGNLMNINGEDVEGQILGLDYGWQIFPTSDVIIKPNVIYLGGKYFYITKDDDCELTMFAGSSSNTIENGDEIFTNQTITIYGKISSNLTPRILVNGVEQEVKSHAQYDFYLDIEVKDVDINVVIQTQSLARTLTVNIDEDAIADYTQPFLKVYSSEYNPDSVDADVYNHGSIYLEDKVQKYVMSLNSGYSITKSTISGLEDVGGNLLKVTDNVVLDYETTLEPTECILYVFNGDISYSWNKYAGYNLTVTRISSKAGGELGEITGYSGQLTETVDGEYVTRKFTGYNVLVQDEISIKIEMRNPDTGLYEFVETTITATPRLSSVSTIQFANGQSFKTATSFGYSISATIE